MENSRRASLNARSEHTSQAPNEERIEGSWEEHATGSDKDSVKSQFDDDERSTIHRSDSKVQAPAEPKERGWLVGFVVRRICVSKATWAELHPPGSVAAIEQVDKPPRRSIYGLRVVPPFHPVCLAWLSFMLLFDLTYTAFWVPLSMGLCVSGQPENVSEPCTQANLFGGIIYTLNLILAFQWGALLEYDTQDIEVRDGITLAKAYMRHGRFVIDVLATIPFVYLVVSLGTGNTTSSSEWLVILSLIRLVRLTRLVNVSKDVFMKAPSSKGKKDGAALSDTTVYIILLAYAMAVLLNLEACIMLYIANWGSPDNSWMVSVSWVDITTATPAQQWLCAVYWVTVTSTTNGYGDIVPKSIAEQVWSNVFMICGLVMFGLLVGTVSNVTTRASADSAKLYSFRKKISGVGEWLDDHHVPEATRRRVKNYFSQAWVDDEHLHLGAEIFKDLPQYVRHNLATYVMLDVLSSLRLFKNQELGLRQLLAQYLRPVDILPGSDLCKQGQECDRLLILTEGQVEARQYLADPLHVTAPCLIGDSVILADELPAFKARCFTIRAPTMSGCHAWELRMVNLWQLLRIYPTLHADMLEHVRNRMLVDLVISQSGMDRPTGQSGRGVTRSDWCEAAASVSRALLRQPQDLIDKTIEELTKAKAEDGTLQQLLDSLLEFSISKEAHAPPGMDRQPSATSSMARAGSVQRVASISMSGLPVLQRTSVGAYVPSRRSRRSSAGGRAPRVSEDVLSAQSMPWPGRSQPKQNRLSATFARPSKELVGLELAPLEEGSERLLKSGHAAGRGSLEFPQLPAVREGSVQDMPEKVPGLPAVSAAPAPAPWVTRHRSGAAAAAATAAGGCSTCPTCHCPVCPTCGRTLVAGPSVPAGGAAAPVTVSPFQLQAGLVDVRSALGLQQAVKPRWRPTRLGRQTLFRVSSLVDRGQRDLSATSIPIQDFGAGYTNFG